jgi:2-keto-3-deoxy-L-rhamnonate aldolase RhmA
MIGPDRATLKSKLAQGQVAVGCLLAYDAPWLVEILGLSGFDFVVIDVEHEVFSDQAVANLVRTADSVGLDAIVRMPLSERLVPLLDAGVRGVKVPDLRGRQHAEELVSLTHFHPVGRRTYYTQGRSARYDIGVDENAWMAAANDQMFLIGMIEDIDVVRQLEDILQVDEIDAFHVGPHDLAQSMGYPSPADLDDVIGGVIRRCREAGKYVSVGVITPWNLDRIGSWVDDGCNFMIAASAWILSQSMLQIHNQIRERIPADRQPQRELLRIMPSKYLNRLER